jgi:hypothetical protein
MAKSKLGPYGESLVVLGWCRLALQAHLLACVFLRNRAKLASSLLHLLE